MNLRHGKVSRYICENCSAKHQANPDGTPTGIPGDKDTRRLRGVAHSRLNAIWDWDSPSEREKMYRFVSKTTGKHHIGELNQKELTLLIRKIPTTNFVRSSVWKQLAKEKGSLTRGSSGDQTG